MNYLRSLGGMAGGFGALTPAVLAGELRPDAPTDATVMSAIESFPIYTRLRSSQLMALMRGIEAGGTSGGSHPLPMGRGPKDFTIEHIAPQELKHWRADLSGWGITLSSMEEVKHSLGNLTAATNTHNKSVGTKSLTRKQSRLSGEPKLHLNSGWERKKRWTPANVKQRSRELARRGLTYWNPI
jgi:hypothetical protein